MGEEQEAVMRRLVEEERRRRKMKGDSRRSSKSMSWSDCEILNEASENLGKNKDGIECECSCEATIFVICLIWRR